MTEPSPDQLRTWLRSSDDAYERKLRDDLTAAANAAEVAARRSSGVVHLRWCKPSGAGVRAWAFDTVPAVVLGYLAGSVRIEPQGSRRGAPVPPAGLYSLETGAPEGTPPRRRHWRIELGDLRALQRASRGVAP